MGVAGMRQGQCRDCVVGSLPAGWVSAGQACDSGDTGKECGGLSGQSQSCWAPTEGWRALGS